MCRPDLALQKVQAAVLGQDGVGGTAGVASHILANVSSQHTLNLLGLKPGATHVHRPGRS